MGEDRLRRTRRVGIVLLVTSITLTAGLGLTTKLENAAAAVGIVGSIIGAYLTWAAYRDQASDRTSTDLTAIADRLAVAVQRQWELEITRQRVNDPRPLPVRWQPADEDLTDSWSTITRLATTGIGWQPADSSAWADGPEDLVGENRELAAVFKRVPSGRLVVLGEPGTGKTMLLIRLVLDLLLQRGPGNAVPILFPLSSWNPNEEDFTTWISMQLVINYPALAAVTNDGHPNQAHALIEAGLILAVLDGLDEMAAPIRGTAISRINDALMPGQHIILSSRSGEFRAAVRATPESPPIRLVGATAIEISALRIDEVHEYLVEARGVESETLWAEVLSIPQVSDTFSTPLMVTLARAIYSHRPTEQNRPRLPDPRELTEYARFPNRESIADYLFEAFIPAAYRDVQFSRIGPQDQYFAGVHNRRYLAFLARLLEDRVRTTDLAWWQIHKAASPIAVGFALGVLLAVIGAVPLVGLFLELPKTSTQLLAYSITVTVGALVPILVSALSALSAAQSSRIIAGLTPAGSVTIASLFLGVLAACPFILFGNLVAGSAVGFGVTVLAIPAAALGADLTSMPSQALRWNMRPAALMFGLPISIAAYFGFEGPAGGAVLTALTMGLAVGIGAVGITGLNPKPIDLTLNVTPQTVFRNDRRSAAMVAITVAGSLTLTTLLVILAQPTVRFYYLDNPNAFHTLDDELFGSIPQIVIFGIAGGLSAGLLRTTWGNFFLARLWLVKRGQLPRNVMSFLDDAHRRGLLRQSGAFYQFRHVELQRHLTHYSDL